MFPSSHHPRAFSWTNSRPLHRSIRTRRCRNREPGRSPPRTRPHQNPRRSWVPSSRRNGPRSKPSRTWCPCEGAGFPRVRPLHHRNKSRPRPLSRSTVTRLLPWIPARVRRGTSSPLGSRHSTSSTFSITRAANSTLIPPLPLARAHRRPRNQVTVYHSIWSRRPSRFRQARPRRPRSGNGRYPAPRRHRPKHRRRLPPRASRDISPLPLHHGRPR